MANGNQGRATRVALATNDGRRVNAHFGNSPYFVIADVTGSGFEIAETRANGAAGGELAPKEHNQTRFDAAIALVSDCGAVIASKIGRASASELQRRRMQALEQSGSIEDLLAGYTKYLGKNGF
ncbi:MAG: hypothetical protein LBJ10_10635, partial [Clostridiales bacterium]|nr:hypothetical protein [Clostridiales bacterium]